VTWAGKASRALLVLQGLAARWKVVSALPMHLSHPLNREKASSMRSDNRNQDTDLPTGPPTVVLNQTSLDPYAFRFVNMQEPLTVGGELNSEIDPWTIDWEELPTLLNEPEGFYGTPIT
jgi:hypothetical protein